MSLLFNGRPVEIRRNELPEEMNDYVLFVMAAAAAGHSKKGEGGERGARSIVSPFVFN